MGSLSVRVQALRGPQSVMVRDPHLFSMDSRAFQINRLTDEQRQRPQDLLTHIFDQVTLQEIRYVFEELLHAALSDDRSELIDTPKSDVLFILNRLEEMAECAYLLYSKRSK